MSQYILSQNSSHSLYRHSRRNKENLKNIPRFRKLFSHPVCQLKWAYNLSRRSRKTFEWEDGGVCCSCSLAWFPMLHTASLLRCVQVVGVWLSHLSPYHWGAWLGKVPDSVHPLHSPWTHTKAKQLGNKYIWASSSLTWWFTPVVPALD